MHSLECLLVASVFKTRFKIDLLDQVFMYNSAFLHIAVKITVSHLKFTEYISAERNNNVLFDY